MTAETSNSLFSLFLYVLLVVLGSHPPSIGSPYVIEPWRGHLWLPWQFYVRPFGNVGVTIWEAPSSAGGDLARTSPASQAYPSLYVDLNRLAGADDL